MRTIVGGLCAGVAILFLAGRSNAPPAVVSDVSTLAGPAPLTVMSWNLQHAQAAGGVRAQVEFISSQSPRPTLVYTEEVSRTLRTRYLDELKSATGDARWTMYYVEHCAHFGSAGSPPCDVLKDEGIAFFTTLPILSSAHILLWGRDDWTDARAAARVTLDLGGGQVVSVFGSHLAAGLTHESARISQTKALKDWARKVAGPRLIAGDFNSIAPTGTAYQAMVTEYADVWSLLRPGETGSSSFSFDAKNGLDRRIDYWFVQNGAEPQASTINRPTFPKDALSDHYPLTASFTIRRDPCLSCSH